MEKLLKQTTYSHDIPHASSLHSILLIPFVSNGPVFFIHGCARKGEAGHHGIKLVRVGGDGGRTEWYL